MRIVLDTNVVMSALLWRGPPYRLLEAIRQHTQSHEDERPPAPPLPLKLSIAPRPAEFHQQPLTANRYSF